MQISQYSTCKSVLIKKDKSLAFQYYKNKVDIFYTRGKEKNMQSKNFNSPGIVIGLIIEYRVIRFDVKKYVNT